jgi:hypothetical protein
MFDAGAEVAGWDDVTGGGADDAGEKMVDFLEVQGDVGSAGLLECFDAGDDAFPTQETASTGARCAAGAGRTGRGAGLAVFAVDVRVGLGGASARGDFAGESFVAGVG